MRIDTVGELISALELHDPDTPVRWAAQPHWPFEYTIGQVVCAPDDADTGPDPNDHDDGESDQPVVWLGEGTQVGYLPGIVSDALGWSA